MKNTPTYPPLIGGNSPDQGEKSPSNKRGLGGVLREFLISNKFLINFYSLISNSGYINKNILGKI
jgi:hypothetical protein